MSKPIKPTSKTPKKQLANSLSNSLRLKSPQDIKRKQNVANILERLPFLRQLNALQNQLISVTPAWQKWLNQVDNKVISQFAALASLDGETLYINCTRTSAATLIKHQQGSLLEHFHKSGFEHIKSIQTQMQLEQTNAPKAATKETLAEQSQSDSLSSSKWKRPSESSLKSIEAATQSTKNEQLAASLQRLADTLKKAT